MSILGRSGGVFRRNDDPNNLPPTPPGTPANYREAVVSMPNLISYWGLGESSGTAAADIPNLTATPGPNPGTFQGAYTLFQGPLVDDASGTHSVLFNDTTGKVVVPDSATLDTLTSNWTVTLMVKFSQTPTAGNFAPLINKSGAGLTAFTMFQYDTNKRFAFNTSGSTNLTSNADSYVLNQPHHVAFVYNGSNLLKKIYVDGVLVGSGAAIASCPVNNLVFEISGGVGGTLIDDVSVFASALTAEQVGLLATSAGMPGQADIPIPPAPPPSGSVIWSANGSQTYSFQWAGFTDLPTSDAGHGTVTSTSNDTTHIRWQRTADATLPSGFYYRSNVESGDRCFYTPSGQRTELGQSNPQKTFSDGTGRRQITQGTSVWLAFAMRIPSSFPASTNWTVLSQTWKCGDPTTGATSGNGAGSWQFLNNKLYFAKKGVQTWGNVNSHITLYQTPSNTVRDIWLKILMFLKVSIYNTGTNAGQYGIWGDMTGAGGTLPELYPLTTGWTSCYDTNGGGRCTISPRIGIYRSAIDAHAHIDYTGFNIAATRADATLHAFGASI